MGKAPKRVWARTTPRIAKAKKPSTHQVPEPEDVCDTDGPVTRSPNESATDGEALVPPSTRVRVGFAHRGESRFRGSPNDVPQSVRFGHDPGQTLGRRPPMPLARERVAYLYDPLSGPAGHALALRCPLLGERQELEQLGLGIDQRRLVCLGELAGGGVHLEELALSFEGHAAGSEVLEEAWGVHRTNLSRGCAVAALS